MDSQWRGRGRGVRSPPASYLHKAEFSVPRCKDYTRLGLISKTYKLQPLAENQRVLTRSRYDRNRWDAAILDPADGHLTLWPMAGVAARVATSDPRQHTSVRPFSYLHYALFLESRTSEVFVCLFACLFACFRFEGSDRDLGSNSSWVRLSPHCRRLQKLGTYQRSRDVQRHSKLKFHT